MLAPWRGGELAVKCAVDRQTDYFVDLSANLASRLI